MKTTRILPPLLNELVLKLSSFLQTFCKQRDSSHDITHCERVCNTSLLIYEGEFSPLTDKHYISNKDFIDLIVICSWTHDVLDHKYKDAKELALSLHKFLLTLIPDKSAQLVLSINERVSFSLENKIKKTGGKLDWEAVLGPQGCLIRDIVSDSDKLDALGKQGLDRCVAFSKYAFEDKFGSPISLPELKTQVSDHSKEKLLRLKDEFIRTKTGKALATSLHLDFLSALDTFLKT